jgi:DNA-binding NtrC family response regulator
LLFPLRSSFIGVRHAAAGGTRCAELATADWPGNIRQLHNAVRQNVALSQTPIPVELVRQSLGGSPDGCPPSMRRAMSSRAATCRERDSGCTARTA